MEPFYNLRCSVPKALSKPNEYLLQKQHWAAFLVCLSTEFLLSPVWVDQEGLECSDLSPLTKMDAKVHLHVVSLAALHLSYIFALPKSRPHYVSADCLGTAATA